MVKNKQTVKSLSIAAVITLSLLSPATFAFEWMDSEPVYVFGEKEAEVSDSSRKQEDPLEKQISQIDLEILMLKAELAQQNGDLKALQQYIEELRNARLPAAFRERLAELESYLESTKPNAFMKFIGLGSGFEFPMDDPKAVVAVVLPLSGTYGGVASQLLKSLREALDTQGFQGRLVEFDSMNYENIFRLWEQVKYYQPKFIFGPLQKNLVSEWHQLDTGIPTLYFNDLQQALFAYEKALSPNTKGQVRKVANYLSKQGYERALIVSDSANKAQSLAEALKERWIMESPGIQVEVYSQKKNFSSGLADALGVSASKNRASVLRNILRRSIETQNRARSDIQAIVSLAKPGQAVQVSPLIEFYQLKNLQHFWYPSQKLKPSDLSLYQNSWQQTTGFIPSYIVDAYMAPELSNTEETGIFYALGQVAVEIVNQAEFLSQRNWLLDTPYGQVEANQNGQFYLLPAVYWLDQGQIEPLEALNEILTRNQK